MFKYKTKGTCSTQIEIDAQDGVIRSVVFTNGCSGNTQGISSLLPGMGVDDAIKRLKGIQCRGGTSCPDQLAQALEKMKQEGLG